MEDEKITELFFKRSEDALAETEKKYGAYLRQEAKAVTGSREDAEECVSDAFFVVW